MLLLYAHRKCRHWRVPHSGRADILGVIRANKAGRNSTVMQGGGVIVKRIMVVIYQTLFYGFVASYLIWRRASRDHVKFRGHRCFGSSPSGKQSQCDPRTLTRSVTNMSELESTTRRYQLPTRILPSSKQAGSRAKLHEIVDDFAYRGRGLVADFTRSCCRDDFPFAVANTDQLQ